MRSPLLIRLAADSGSGKMKLTHYVKFNMLDNRQLALLHGVSSHTTPQPTSPS